MWFFKKKIDDQDWEGLNSEVVRLTNDRKMDEALTAGVKLLRLCKRNFGGKHKHTVTALNNLGTIHTLRKDFTEAESYLLAALQISEKVSGEMSIEVALVNMNLANLYSFKAKMITEAIGRLRENQQ